MEDQTETLARIPPKKNRGGVWVPFGDEEYKVPPLGLLGVQELLDDIPKLQGIKGVPTPAQMQMVATIVHKAMRRNYPDMSVEEVAEMLDLANFQSALDAVMKVSGFVRHAPGEKAPGETKASTGSPSTST